MDTYEIKKITPDDKSKIKEFLHKAYFPDLPPLNAMNVTEVHPFQTSVILNIIDEDLSYAAVSKDGTILGILLIGEITHGNLEKRKKLMQNCPAEYYLKILKFLEKVENDAKILETAQRDKGLDLKIAGVLPTARNRGVMKRLFHFVTEIAAQKSYKLLACHCASQYTADLCQALSWTCVYCLPYISYEIDGERIFKYPVYPHLYSRVFFANRIYNVDTDRYEIQKITPDDKPKIKEFLHKAYFPYVPDLKAMNITEVDPIHESSLLDIIDEDFSYAAVSNGGTILGIVLVTKYTNKNSAKREKILQNCPANYFAKRLKFLEKVENDAKILEIAQCEEGLAVTSGAVLPTARKRGVMKRLGVFCAKMAKEKNFKLLIADCASQYTADLCQALGWTCVYCLPNISYEIDGERIFKNPVFPHLYTRMYVKYL